MKGERTSSRVLLARVLLTVLVRIARLVHCAALRVAGGAVVRLREVGVTVVAAERVGRVASKAVPLLLVRHSRPLRGLLVPQCAQTAAREGDGPEGSFEAARVPLSTVEARSSCVNTSSSTCSSRLAQLCPLSG